MFSRILPRSFWGGAEPVDLLKTAGAASTAGPRGRRASGPACRGVGDRDLVGEIDPEEVEPRSSLADALRLAGLFPLAEAEVEKILVIQPDHIPTRMMRAEQAIAARPVRRRPGRARRRPEPSRPGGLRPRQQQVPRPLLLHHPPLPEGGEGPTRRGGWPSAPGTWRSGSIAIVGQAHYNLARVYAVLGASDPGLIQEAAKQLYRAFIVNQDYQQRYRNDRGSRPAPRRRRPLVRPGADPHR